MLPQRYKFSSKSQLIKESNSRMYGCCCYRKGTNFQANHNGKELEAFTSVVVVATAKVQIFKQITTDCMIEHRKSELLLLPQRYKFSSKSQPLSKLYGTDTCCCCYRKGTNFQANHNYGWRPIEQANVVVATAKVQIFKQITTCTYIHINYIGLLLLPQRYKFSSKSQLAHLRRIHIAVVVATAKVQIFKQITTIQSGTLQPIQLLLLPQRYKFSSKSQHEERKPAGSKCCCCYRKGTNFQANHNSWHTCNNAEFVVVATAKVQIFKQITTASVVCKSLHKLLLLPQRYKFSSKSQHFLGDLVNGIGCCCYRKGTNFQANHNTFLHKKNRK